MWSLEILRSALRLFLFLFLFAGLSGCKKPIPDPEALDPIYRDLKGLADSKKKEWEESIKAKEAALKALEKEKPNTLEKKLAQRDYDKANSKIAQLEQEAHYFEIRAQRRRVEDKVNYMEAFKNDKPWPPPDEYPAWLVNRKLAEAPRTWGTDLPKLYNNGAGPKKPAKKPEGEAKEE